MLLDLRLKTDPGWHRQVDLSQLPQKDEAILLGPDLLTAECFVVLLRIWHTEGDTVATLVGDLTAGTEPPLTEDELRNLKDPTKDNDK
ncbi:hypothetical protein [Georgenia sp. AZ-5]|uniref:hypothetical protein n=1 Tax=Georgenia sp. AZ-5 TaxID=3367526 RepID=UPI003755004A